MSGKQTNKRRRRVKQAKAKRRRKRRAVEEVVRTCARALDEKFGTDWRSDPLLVAKFERVVIEEIEATKHQGLVVPADALIKQGPEGTMENLHRRVFGEGDPRLVSARPVD